MAFQILFFQKRQGRSFEWTFVEQLNRFMFHPENPNVPLASELKFQELFFSHKKLHAFQGG